MARIDGVQVSEGGNVKWGLVASLLVSAPLYAVLEGYVETIQLYGSAASKAVSAPGKFVAEWLSLLFAGGERAISAAWWSFLGSVSGTAPLMAFPVTVAAVVLTLLILSWGVRQIDV